MTYTDYLLVISLPDALKKEISRYKQASVNIIGDFEGMHSMALITLTHQTRCKPFWVQPAITRWEYKLSSVPPVKLHINGFNYLNHGATAKTIYAVVERTPQTVNWFKLIRQQLGLRINHLVPHITIAQNIPVTAFNSLWPNFRDRQFSETFMADSITILQRDTFAEYCEWRVHRELFLADKLAIF